MWRFVCCFPSCSLRKLPLFAILSLSVPVVRFMVMGPVFFVPGHCERLQNTKIKLQDSHTLHERLWVVGNNYWGFYKWELDFRSSIWDASSIGSLSFLPSCNVTEILSCRFSQRAFGCLIGRPPLGLPGLGLCNKDGKFILGISLSSPQICSLAPALD